MFKGFFATLLCGAFLLAFVAVSPSASAVVCIADGRGYGTTTPGATNEYGARVINLTVINTNSECGLVRSVYVYEAQTDHFEIGWYQDGTDQDFAVCDNHLDPHLLVYQRRNGAVSCRHPVPALTLGEDYSFLVTNPDHDFRFNFYWDDDTSPDIAAGSFLGDISNGQARSGDEHHHPSAADSMRADFSGMGSLGSTGLWHAFPSASLYTKNPVTGWVVCLWGNTYLQVRGSGNC